MTLLVLGAPQALATAALAALTSGEAIAVRTIDTDPVLPAKASHNGVTSPVQLTPLDSSTTVDACIVVDEARNFRRLFEQYRETLHGIPVLLSPGGFAGALRFTAWDATIRAAEVTGFPAAGAVDGDTFVLRGVKNDLPIAAADPTKTETLAAEFVRYIPGLIGSDLRSTSMSNTNHLIHPPVTLLNAVRIDSAAPFTLYREGVSRALEPLLEAVDAERRSICRAIGADDRSGRDWMLRFYRASGMAGDDLVSCLRSYPAFEGVMGPSTLDYRYLADDIPHGMGQWSRLGHSIGVPTPSIDNILSILSIVAPDIDLEPDEEAYDLFVEHTAEPAEPAVASR